MKNLKTFEKFKVDFINEEKGEEKKKEKDEVSSDGPGKVKRKPKDEVPTKGVNKIKKDKNGKIVSKTDVQGNVVEEEENISEGNGPGDKMKCKDVGVQKKINKGGSSTKTKPGTYVFYKAIPTPPKFKREGEPTPKPKPKYFKKDANGYKTASLGEINKMKKNGKVTIKTMPPKEIKKALGK